MQFESKSEWIFFLQLYCEFLVHKRAIINFWNVSEQDAERLISYHKEYLNANPPLPYIVQYECVSRWCGELNMPYVQPESLRDRAGRIVTKILTHLLPTDYPIDYSVREGFKDFLYNYFLKNNDYCLNEK